MDEILHASALWAVLLTVAAYQLGAYLKKRTGRALCNPVLVATVLIIALLLVLRIPNADYQAGMQGISWLLTPCTVCLAIPLHSQMSKLKGNLAAVMTGVIAGSAVSLLLIGGACLLLGLDKEVTAALLPKSITTAMAMPLAEQAGALVPLTTAAVIVTGILGSVAGPWLCKVLRITDPMAQGVAFGTASHVIGTSKAIELDRLSGAVSSLSLVVAGVVTAVLYPLLLPLLCP